MPPGQLALVDVLLLARGGRYPSSRSERGAPVMTSATVAKVVLSTVTVSTSLGRTAGVVKQPGHVLLLFLSVVVSVPRAIAPGDGEVIRATSMKIAMATRAMMPLQLYTALGGEEEQNAATG